MAIDRNTVYEVRTGGAPNNGAGFHWVGLVNSTYKWTLSGSGTNEYHCELAAGGDPGLTEPHSVCTDGRHNLATQGVLGSLAAGEWAWGDNDALGYNTLYVRLANGLDPDAMIAYGERDIVQMGYGGGQDYSQQNNAELILADVATDAAGTTLTSVTGGFTSLMVGNMACITGGGTTEQWYEVRTRVDANTITIDRSCGANKVAVRCAIGGAYAFGGASGLQNQFWSMNTMVPGNRCWIRSGNHPALACDWNFSVAGDTTWVNYCLGYGSTRGDLPLGNSRPLINMGDWQWNCSGSILTVTGSFRLTGTGPYVIINVPGNSFVFNIKATNTSALAGHHAFYVASNAGMTLIGCEASCGNTDPTTYAFFFGGMQNHLFGCFAHDAGVGIHYNTNYGSIERCVVADCPTRGIYMGGYGRAWNNLVYNCGEGIKTPDTQFIFNNIITDCTTGITGVAALDSIFAMFNCLHNTTDFNNRVTLPFGNIFADPGLANPPAHDYRIGLSDPPAKAAAEAGTFTGARLF